MATIKHTKVSAKADGSDPSLILPSDWNADHSVVLAIADTTGLQAALDAKSPNVYGPYASAAALQTAFPAAANTGRRAFVGTGAPYIDYVSNGTTWVAAGTVATYLGQVATHCKYPEGKFGSSANAQISCRIMHVATENMRGAQLKYVNYYGPSATAPGSAVTVTVGLEYPTGVMNRVKFSAANSISIPDGNDTLSDALDFDIPAGAVFYEHVKAAWTGIGAMYALSSNNVDASTTGTNTPDNTGTGSISGLGGGQFVYGFMEAQGQTSKPSYLIIGDSRAAGAGDTAGWGTNSIGAIERALSIANVAWVSIAASGAAIWMFTASAPTKIKQIGNRVSGIIIGGGINDINGGDSAATLKTNVQSVISDFNPSKRKPTYLCTVEPYTTSTDSWATETNQTIWDATKNTQRDLHNANVRSNNIVGQWAFFDIALRVESQVNPGKWLAPGYTGDGLHALTKGYLQEVIALPTGFGSNAYVY